MKYIKGDLVEMGMQGDLDVIVHGCNCLNNMGAGIAATIRKLIPAAYEADQKTLKGDKDKVGTYTQATAKFNEHSLTVINAYTQYNYNGPKGIDLFEYDGFQKILETLKTEFKGKRIGFPLIGCGLAGGNKDRIMDMIKNELNDLDVTVVEWTQNYVPLYRKMK